MATHTDEAPQRRTPRKSPIIPQERPRGRPPAPANQQPVSVIIRFPPHILLALDQWCAKKQFKSRSKGVNGMVEAALGRAKLL